MELLADHDPKEARKLLDPVHPRPESRAGRLTRLGGRHVLRLSHNPATEALYASISHRLAA
jgi:hypothetical protein